MAKIIITIIFVIITFLGILVYLKKVLKINKVIKK